jgi:hypothetical protein
MVYRGRNFQNFDEWFQGGFYYNRKTINPKLSLSSPPYERKERNSNEWHQAHWFFTPRELFWGSEKLCADARGIRVLFYGG